LKRTPVGLGEISITRDPEERLCVFGLGSCVALYLYAPGRPESALAHVVLPKNPGRSGEPGRYADTAVQALVGEMQALGLSMTDLRASIAGGAELLGLSNNIGQSNVLAVKEALALHGVLLMEENTGGSQGRTVEFDPVTQVLLVRILSGPQISI
jgi:chemotaxis protein CheD